MLQWTIQITIISIIMVFLVHHLINFFKSTLTVPKIKDLVNTPTQKYEAMYNVIKNNRPNTGEAKYNQEDGGDYTLIDLLPTVNEKPPAKPKQNMKSELKNFLKTQMNDVYNGNTESYSKY
jgi:hypothetical protein